MESLSTLHFGAILWLVLVLRSSSSGNSKLAAAKIEKAERRLASENPGAINIDCGAPDNYYYPPLEVDYKTDSYFTDAGENRVISIDPWTPIWSQLRDLRIFPNGTRNCYSLKPEQGKNNKYLIRAMFLYGNYDGRNSTPAFDVHLGVNLWLQVTNDYAVEEIIFVSSTDTIDVCLVNTGFGIPYISALELRILDNNIYPSQSEALLTVKRYDVGISGDLMNRYKDDVYDRVWWSYPYRRPDWISISTTASIDVQDSNDSYKLPSQVLSNAGKPKSGISYLSYTYTSPSDDLFIYFHLAEIEEIPQGQKRELTINLNGEDSGPVTLEYLRPQTILLNKTPIRGDIHFNISSLSDLPPILNAFEILREHSLPLSPTDSADVEAIMSIKQIYKLKRDDSQGDPCLPRNFSWSGLKCSNDNNHSRIITLHLSSSKLTGEIASAFSNFKAIQSLDLSDNELTGPIPEFLAELPNLSFINVSLNKLSGPIPYSLMQKSINGMLQLSSDGNPNLCQPDACPKKKPSFLLPIIASSVSVLVLLLLSIIAIFCIKKRRKGTKSIMELPLRSKNQSFIYSDIVTMTNNFKNIIGEGGFGKVYLGNLKDGTPVAVKVLSKSSRQGFKEFQAEVQLLKLVYHRNLVSLIGYCDDHDNMALVYEYMANGNLREHLSARSLKVLNWKQRLQIAVDAAQGLEYLHNSCKPPIIHRDLKTANILLNESLQAKIADFGLSRVFATENDSHVTTQPAGTLGYLDPEFHSSGNYKKKSDVYSFGVVLFELITGQPAVIRGEEYNTHIVQWVRPLIESGDISSVIDQRLRGELGTNSAWKAVEIAMSCVPTTAIQRPDMSHILTELKECMAVEIASGDQRDTRRSSNSLGMDSLIFDTDMVPSVR